MDFEDTKEKLLLYINSGKYEEVVYPNYRSIYRDGITSLTEAVSRWISQEDGQSASEEEILAARDVGRIAIDCIIIGMPKEHEDIIRLVSDLLFNCNKIMGDDIVDFRREEINILLRWKDETISMIEMMRVLNSQAKRLSSLSIPAYECSDHYIKRIINGGGLS